MWEVWPSIPLIFLLLYWTGPRCAGNRVRCQLLTRNHYFRDSYALQIASNADRIVSASKQNAHMFTLTYSKVQRWVWSVVVLYFFSLAKSIKSDTTSEKIYNILKITFDEYPARLIVVCLAVPFLAQFNAFSHHTPNTLNATEFLFGNTGVSRRKKKSFEMRKNRNNWIILNSHLIHICNYWMENSPQKRTSHRVTGRCPTPDRIPSIGHGAASLRVACCLWQAYQRRTIAWYTSLLRN